MWVLANVDIFIGRWLNLNLNESVREHPSPGWSAAHCSAGLCNLAAVRVQVVHLAFGLRRRRAQLKPCLACVEV
eukprot:COSAG02_NODE_14576_length_1258_cov_1.227783_2_plen_73_part_01